MLALFIILAVLLLFLTVPLGIDAARNPEQTYLKLKLGLFRITILPGKKKEKPSENIKKKKTKETKQPDKEKGKKQKLTWEDIRQLLEIALDALRRLRMYLSVDYFRFHWVAAAEDPYDAVVQFGRINAVLGTLRGMTHRSLKIRDEDLSTQLDLNAAKPVVDTRIIVSLQIWEILVIAICAGFALLRLRSGKRRAQVTAAAVAERS